MRGVGSAVPKFSSSLAQPAIPKSGRELLRLSKEEESLADPRWPLFARLAEKRSVGTALCKLGRNCRDFPTLVRMKRALDPLMT